MSAAPAAVGIAAQRLVDWCEDPQPAHHNRRYCRVCGRWLEGQDPGWAHPAGHADGCIVQDLRNALYGGVMPPDVEMAVDGGLEDVGKRPGLGPMEVDQD